MTARCTIGAVSLEVRLADDRFEVTLERGRVRLRDGFVWSLDLASGIRRWARACTADLDGVTWSSWGRRAGRWTLIAEQGPAGGIWTAAYRIGAETITVAGGDVPTLTSVRCVHGQRLTSEAVVRARLAVEEAVIAWVRAVRSALCATLGEASRSGVAA